MMVLMDLVDFVHQNALEDLVQKIYDEQNMRDRLKAYLESGYKFELYIDKKRDYSLVG